MTTRRAMLGLLAGGTAAFFGRAASAQENFPASGDDPALRYANGIYLAYIRSASPGINVSAADGLKTLAGIVGKKTNLKPDAGEFPEIDLETSALLPLFRFVYWPVGQDEPALSDAAQKKVQSYLDSRRGMIMFDVLDTSDPDPRERIVRLLGKVNLGPLGKLDQSHTLSRTFYLTDGLPGSYTNQPVYVQIRTGSAQGATSVVAGRANWTDAWLGITLRRDSPEHEQAVRGGINAVLHAFTGGYRRDYDNTRKILKRIRGGGETPPPAQNAP